MKSIIFYIVVFASINSCQTKKISPDIDIIESIPFSKENFYKYDNGYLKNNLQELDSFKSNIYTIVEPLEENRKLPKKIYALPFDRKRWKKSVNFFEKKLEGKNLSYLEVNNKIIVREFYNDYSIDSTNNVSEITNVAELKKKLENRKLSYKLIKLEKVASTDVVNIDIENKYYKIILNKNMCKSYLFYNKKDTMNYYLYQNVFSNFFY